MVVRSGSLAYVPFETLYEAELFGPIAPAAAPVVKIEPFTIPRLVVFPFEKVPHAFDAQLRLMLLTLRPEPINPATTCAGVSPELTTSCACNEPRKQKTNRKGRSFFKSYIFKLDCKDNF